LEIDGPDGRRVLALERPGALVRVASLRFYVDYEAGARALRLHNAGEVPLIGSEGPARCGEDLFTAYGEDVGAGAFSLRFRRSA